MRPMNSHLRVRKFKMTGTSMWKSLICKDLFMATLDIKDAYLHVPIAKESRRFMRYQWRGEIFELGALPFGLGQAPYVFTRLLQPLLARWRSSLGIVIILLGFIASRSQTIHPGFFGAIDVRLAPATHVKGVNPTVPEPERSVSIFRAREKEKRCGFMSVSVPC